jgi:hypothetical protein
MQELGSAVEDLAASLSFKRVNSVRRNFSVISAAIGHVSSRRRKQKKNWPLENFDIGNGLLGETTSRIAGYFSGEATKTN